MHIKLLYHSFFRREQSVNKKRNVIHREEIIMSKKEVPDNRSFGFKDKIGYALGDCGNDFTFILSSSFMLIFYSNVMGVDAWIGGVIMMAARFIDAVTDVTMGQIVDRSKPTKNGKFRPWLKRMCIPVALCSFLIYQSALSGLSLGFKIAWMAVTYILWGSIFYTSINIPYSSMASAITEDPTQRAQLSTFRTIGATIAGLLIGMIVPMTAYVYIDGVSTLSGTRMTIIAGIFSLCAIACYLLCYKLTTERVPVPQLTTKLDIPGLLKSLVTNRALLGIMGAAIALLLGQLGMGTMAGYLFTSYYNNGSAASFASLFGCIGILGICTTTAVPISRRIGKKEMSVISCAFSALVYVVCLIMRPSSIWVYILFFTLAYIGLGFFNTVIWAMIIDVIDDAEVKNGVREDGTIYSIYSFARKLGQALAAGISGILVSAVGYTSAVAADPSAYPDVLNGLFNATCIVPIVGFSLVVVCLVFVYPLGKKRVDDNARILAERRENR